MQKKINKLVTNIKLNISFYSIVLFAFVVRFKNALNTNLYYDEGAAWHVANKTSFLNILLGKYDHIGDMPGSYIFMKFWFNYFHSVVESRLLFILAGVASIIVVYKIFRIFENRLYAQLGILLLSISPAHIEYSSIIRSYIVGFLFQSLLLYFLCLVLTRKDNKNLFVKFCLFGFLSISSSFSSFYLLFIIVALLSVYIYNRSDSKDSYIKTLKKYLIASVIIFTSGLLWIIYYRYQPSWGNALLSYVDYRNTNILKSFVELLKELIFFTPYWKGRFLLYMPRVYTLTQYMSVILVSLITTYTTYLGITSIREYLKNKKITSKYIFTNLILMTFVASIIFSFVFFNVISIKLTLYLLIPWIYIIITMIRSFITKRWFAATTIILVLLATTSLYSLLRNQKQEIYPSENVYNTIVDDKRDKNLLIVDNAFAIDLLEYYESIYNKEIFKNMDVVELNTSYSNSINLLENYPLLNNDLNGKYNKIFYFNYYGNWQRDYTESYIKFSKNISNYYANSNSFNEKEDQYFTLSILSDSQ